jgi:hypothetical protein
VSTVDNRPPALAIETVTWYNHRTSKYNIACDAAVCKKKKEKITIIRHKLLALQSEEEK